MAERARRRAPLILASGSQARKQMLAAAGLQFDVVPADIDERAIRTALETGDNPLEPDDIADILARAKAEHVSRAKPEALVIGSDQVLALDETIFEKPANADVARANLLSMRGRAHELHAAVALAHGGETVWSHSDIATMTMRKFSAGFLDDYIAKSGNGILSSVGAYQLEGMGVQLFEKIEGDYFTILGMPLLPLLQELRARGVVAA